jgi:hypothetical protein
LNEVLGIIADNFGKAGLTWAPSQVWIQKGERSSLPARIAATEKLSAFAELELASLGNNCRIVRGKV